MNYNELKNRIHHLAKSAGWHEEQRQTDELLTLILSEMFEAFEAYRDSYFSEDFSYEVMKALISTDIEAFKVIFKEEIKDTLQDEIADTFIRILDMAGLYDLEIKGVQPISVVKDFAIIQKQFTLLISGMYNEQMTSEKISILLGFLLEVSRLYEFDLETHIELKLEYNKTRGYRHGGKVL
jgi:NTP pyrophosphatase (non-canonical NTP hydrolase)